MPLEIEMNQTQRIQWEKAAITTSIAASGIAEALAANDNNKLMLYFVMFVLAIPQLKDLGDLLKEVKTKSASCAEDDISTVIDRL